VTEREAACTVTAERAGQTVAAVVRELVPGLSWSKARELVQGGQVRVDGRAATDPAQRLREGERVEVGGRPGVSEGRREPEILVHLDAEVAVVRKPAGLLTVPFERTDRDTLLSRARVAIRRLEASRGMAHNPSLRAVQRLDKDTSGLVVFARTIPAQRHLQTQFTEHTALRRYLAVVHGSARDATFDTILVPDRGDGLRGSFLDSPSPGRRGGDGRGGQGVRSRRAVTHVKVQERLRGATLVSCRLETGRTHQIRIHLSEDRHPLLGETVYVRDFAGPRLPAPRLMLHATELGFVHPRTGKELRFVDPPPEDFAVVLEDLKLSTTPVVESRE
jgi:23S rRNA pseudouridine1911/1915/1917 synthase